MKTFEAAVVPWGLLIDVVVYLHRELAHLGRDKMLHLIRQHLFHPNLYMAVRDTCSSCPECQIMKVARQVHVPPTMKIVTSYPFELMACDLVLFPKSKEGFIGCLMVIDHNSKLLFAVPIKNKTSQTTVQAFESRVLPFLPRIPDKLLTDNGPEFIAETFNQMLGKYKENMHVASGSIQFVGL